jgi:EAL domain-containing protein (putative c-di-GMP-specific phosphodiesterase class I)
MFLLYQPLVCLSERQVIGFEALIRWQHPALGLLSPAQFLTIAEETGLVIPMGYWVIRQACQLIRQREQQSLAPVKFSVNLAPQQFADATLVDSIQNILVDAGAQSELLELEITETVLMANIANAIETLKQLRELGISIAIDDFGTGYSSFSYIKNLPVDTLKIDRSFITGIADQNSGDRIIVEAILAMAGKLKLKVIAEGIETAEQLTFLESIYCEFAQGYLFAHPLAVEKMLRFPVNLDKSWPTDKLI